MRQRLEFILVFVLVRGLGILPRRWARAAGAGLGALAFMVTGRLRRTGERNLQLAYPAGDHAWRKRILRQLYRNLGLHLAEFCVMSRYTPESTRSLVRYAGLEHYLAARERGQGVLVITGHLGLWELSSFYHSLMGYPMSMVIRRLDNPLVDRLVNGIRCLHGNTVLHKDDFARGLLGAMRRGETVGILMDTNMTPPQGVFVDFFGVPACTASGLARVAMRTEAAVLPGFLTWREEEKKYVLEFGERLELVRTGNDELDIVTNTQICTTAIEIWVRRFPEQWLWVHRRWKTRPPGEPSLYS
ncbi:MAG TPA: lysophospholipid acyltransferase family protein [Acidobacteriaceae bacterium]|nr:lysophospholipid acyltransferase family protein [Acidobacteriaceae bacterium]